MDCETRQAFDTGVSTKEPGRTPCAVFVWYAELADFIAVTKALAVIETVEAVYIYVFGRGAYRAEIFVVAPFLDTPSSGIHFLTLGTWFALSQLVPHWLLVSRVTLAIKKTIVARSAEYAL